MNRHHQPVTRLDDCQYVLSSHINDTVTNFADHTDKFSHDALNRYVAGDRIPPNQVWVNVKHHVVQTSKGALLCDDTVMNTPFSCHMDLVRRQ